MNKTVNAAATVVLCFACLHWAGMTWAGEPDDQAEQKVESTKKTTYPWQTDFTFFTASGGVVTSSGIFNGFRLELGRFRWTNFQLGILDVALIGPFESPGSLGVSLSIGSVGGKYHLGADKRHEIGLMLGFAISFATYTRGGATASSARYCTRGLFPTTLYYRYNADVIHLEAGLVLPLYWFKAWEHSRDEEDWELYGYRDKPYSGMPPLLIYVGIGI